VQGIYAAGDAAQAFDPAYRMTRVNTSWRTAREQGETAGLNMAGADVCCNGTIGSNYQVFGRIPFVSIGYANPDAESDSIRIEKALDREAGVYDKRVYRDGILIGAVLVGDTSSAGDLERAIRRALI
jgi:NAD(P)H-nitrite reductase large subunit